jgi:signal transduction histidine kinase
MTNRERNG